MHRATNSRFEVGEHKIKSKFEEKLYSKQIKYASCKSNHCYRRMHEINI